MYPTPSNSDVPVELTQLADRKGDSHQIWRTQRVQVNVASLRLFLRSCTGPNRAFEPQALGRVRDPVRIAEEPRAEPTAEVKRDSHHGAERSQSPNLDPCQPSSPSNRPR